MNEQLVDEDQIEQEVLVRTVSNIALNSDGTFSPIKPNMTEAEIIEARMAYLDSPITK